MMKRICTISLAVLTLAVTACGGGSGTNSDAVISEEIAKEAAIKLAAESLEEEIDIYSEELAECILEGFREFANNNISWKDIAEAFERDGDLTNIGVVDEPTEEDAQELFLGCLAETDTFQELMDDAVEDVISNSGEGGNYGDDPVLDDLYDQCADGDNQACDDLFWQSPSGSEYEAFGSDCGGQVDRTYPCIVEERKYGDDPYLDSLYDQCADGDNQACDDLFLASPGGSEYEAFGSDCGGQVDRTYPCTDEGGNYGDDPYLDSLYDQCANGDDEACDDLFWTSPYAFAGSEYVDFALTCGGRDCQIPISEMGSRNYWPMRYGDDADLDNLYDQCANGDDQACNDLFLLSNETSEYSFFAALCGFRDCVIPISETFENDIPATEIPFFYGEDDFLDNLYDQCADGNDEACDDLFWQSVGGSEYGNFALTCGGRGCQIPMDGRSMNYGDNAYLDNLYDQCADGNDQACNDLYSQSFGGSEYEEFALTCGGRGCQIPG